MEVCGSQICPAFLWRVIKKKCDICTIEVRKSQRTSNEVVVGVGVSQRLSGNIHFSKSGLEYSAGLWGKFVIRISTVDFDIYLKKQHKKTTPLRKQQQCAGLPAQ